MNLHASYCNITGSKVLHIKSLAKFAVDLCMTFLHFQSSPKWTDLVNMITLQELHAWCFYLKKKDVLYIKIWKRSSTLTFVWPFWTFKLAHGQACTENAITPQELYAMCCNCTVMFFTSKTHTSSVLTLFWSLWTFVLAHGQIGGK